MPLDHQAVEILKKVATEPGLTTTMLCQQIDLPLTHFYYRRSHINNWLDACGFSPLQNDPVRGLRLQENEIAEIVRQLDTIDAQQYKLSAKERRDNLLLYLACHTRPTFTLQLCELNRVSRNTTLNDIAILKRYLWEKHQLMLEVSKKRGYQINGESLSIRLMIQSLMQRILKYSDQHAQYRITRILQHHAVVHGMMPQGTEALIDNVLQQAEKQLGFEFTDKDRRLLHYVLLFSLIDMQNGNTPLFTPAQSAFLRNLAECKVAVWLNNQLVDALGCLNMTGNALYFTLLFSTSKTRGDRGKGQVSDTRLMAITRHLIAKFQSLSGVYIQETELLASRLYAHLGPAIRRCLFGVRSENVLREETLQRYPLIFRLCRQIVTLAEQEYQISFSDDELSYIVISFAAWLDRRPETQEQHLVLITEGGLSSTAILENQLRNLTVLPLHIEHRSMNQIQQYGIATHVRLVVSTIALACPLPGHVSFIRTQHILTEAEKQHVRLLLEHNLHARGIERLVSSLVISAQHHQASQDKTRLHQAFRAIIENFLHKSTLPAIPEKGLSRLHIGYSSQQTGWRQVIRRAARPLVEEGVIDAHYVRNIIRHTETRGVTTSLTPDILLLHDAPPTDLETGAISLLKLGHPLHFDIPGVTVTPRLIVVLVPAKNLSHIPLLESLNILISNEEALDALLKASSLHEVRHCIHRCQNNEEVR